jgi:hypothetical protein
MNEMTAEARISVQRRGHENDLKGGHLASGLLADSHTVLVPEAVQELVEDRSEIELLIFDADAHDRTVVERIPPSRIDTFQIGTERNWTVFAIVVLARPAVHSPLRVRLDGCVFDKELIQAGGNLRVVLERLDLVSKDALERPSDSVFDVVQQREREQRLPVRRDFVLPEAPPIWGICDIVPFCEPCPPDRRP